MESIPTIQVKIEGFDHPIKINQDSFDPQQHTLWADFVASQQEDPKKTDFAAMKVAELTAKIDELGLDRSEAKTKADLVAILESNEQASA